LPGPDQVTAHGLAHDRAIGGLGADKLDVFDNRGGDVARGGGGVDACLVDPQDRVFRCEHVTTNG
jgi:hypothetical protein